MSTRGYADTRLGQIHYVEQGTGSPLLLLHQTPRSWDEFAELVPKLSEGRRVIAIDMPGFGLSYHLPAPQTIEDYAQGVIAFADVLHLQRFSVLGHHTGGAVAIELAALQPDRLTALVLSSTPWIDRSYREAHTAGAGVDEAVVDASGSHLATLWRLREPYYPPGRPELLNRFIRDALAPGLDPAEGHRACARYAMERRVSSVTAPTLLIGASGDPFALPDVPRLKTHLVNVPKIEEHIVEGGTIPLIEDRTEEVAAVVNRFLAYQGL
ncbi:alpha/beta fold hydrolase [Amycolatopsis sp. NPDC004368]